MVGEGPYRARVDIGVDAPIRAVRKDAHDAKKDLTPREIRKLGQKPSRKFLRD